MLPLLLRYGYLAAMFFLTSVFALVLTFFHFFSTYFLLAESSIINGIKYTALTKFDETARSLGYQPQSLAALAAASVYIPPKTIDDIVIREAKRFKVSPNLLNAIKYCESSEQFTATSVVGATGLMQVMPKNAEHCGIPEYKLHDPEANIKCGAQLISENIDRRGNRVVPALEEYLGGSECIGGGCKDGKEYLDCVINKMAGRDRPKKLKLKS